jgi:LDH2 family malate/lactate/ureidoglycolate dehydrogenase
MPRLSADQLRDFGTALFVAAGAPEDVARSVSGSLVLSNLRGHDSHGIAQAVGYLGLINQGRLDPTARPTILNERPTTALIDGNWGFGSLAATFAIETLIRKARENAVAAVGIRRCNHIGRLGEYVEHAARSGVLAMMTLCGGGRGTTTTPYGGAGRTLGSNPFAFGLPAEAYPPVVVDFATTVVAGGKIAVAREKGEYVPEGWLLDREGRPTRDPNDFANGGMLRTMADYKGTGLSLVAEALGGALTGATGFEAGEQTRNCVFAWGIAVDAFQPAEDYYRLEDRSIEKVKATPPAPGFERVLIPGERGRANQARREERGIEIPESTWEKLMALARDSGVKTPSPMPPTSA